MVKSSNTHMEEHDETDMYEELHATMNSSSTKAQGRTAHRSKHSETEQRRRSKINERFQVLRNIIPQSDQKRDKASLLLEVIDYIRFLKEKLDMYEVNFPVVNPEREATKLMPWRNNQCVTVENFEQTRVLNNNGLTHENNVMTSSGMVAKPQNSMESDFSSANVYKPATDLVSSVPTPQMVTLDNVSGQQQLNIFANMARGVMPTQALQEPSLCDADNNMGVYNPQSQLWQGHGQGQGRPCMAETTAGPSSLLHDHEFMLDSEYNYSNIFSQGILDTVTQALQSSGVDLSETSISVQLDVARRVNNEQSAMASCSQDPEKQYENTQALAQTRIRSSSEVSDIAHRRLRTGKG